MRTFRGQAIEASKALAAFVVELDKDGMPERSPRRGGLTVDDLVQEYWLYAETQGRAHSTLVAYRDVYKHWVAPPCSTPFFRAPPGIRTQNLWIKSPLLCH